jgi:hypothetical protein
MKFFLKSKTVIGIVIPVLIQLAPLVGLSLTSDDTALINSTVDQLLQLASLGFAMYGRFVAKEPLKLGT